MGKKLISLIFSSIIAIVFSGCLENAACQGINKEALMVTKSISHDGKYRISSEVNEGEGIYKVVLSTGNGKGIIKTFEIVGANHSFLWSPNNQRVCVSYNGRIWGDFSVIDATAEKLIEHPSVDDIINSFKKQKIKFGYNLNPNRPDPYLSPIEWSPDSKELLVFYQWHDVNYATQNGVFIYNIETNRVSNLIQYPANHDGANLEAKKPGDFKW